MLTPQFQQEWLSLVYLSAVLARAGMIFQAHHPDVGGVDLTIRALTLTKDKRGNLRFIESGEAIDVQLKSTKNVEE